MEDKGIMLAYLTPGTVGRGDSAARIYGNQGFELLLQSQLRLVLTGYQMQRKTHPTSGLRTPGHPTSGNTDNSNGREEVEHILNTPEVKVGPKIFKRSKGTNVSFSNDASD